MDPLFEIQDVEKHFGTVIALGVSIFLFRKVSVILPGDNGR